MNEYATEKLGAKILGWAKFEESGLTGGVSKFITEEMVKENAVIIDVGINRTPDGKIVGDVDYDNLLDKVSYITPVPGGVGQMTRAMLINNIIKAAEGK